MFSQQCRLSSELIILREALDLAMVMLGPLSLVYVGGASGASQMTNSRTHD